MKQEEEDEDEVGERKKEKKIKRTKTGILFLNDEKYNALLLFHLTCVR